MNSYSSVAVDDLDLDVVVVVVVVAVSQILDCPAIVIDLLVALMWGVTVVAVVVAEHEFVHVTDWYATFVESDDPFGSDAFATEIDLTTVDVTQAVVSHEVAVDLVAVVAA